MYIVCTYVWYIQRNLYCKKSFVNFIPSKNVYFIAEKLKVKYFLQIW